MKEYILMLDRRPVGKMFIDDNNLFHLWSNEVWYEFVSIEPIASIDQVTDVLLDKGHEAKYIRIAARYLEIPDRDKQRNLAVSIYSKSGNLKSRIYIHDVDEKRLISYINSDSIVIRTPRDLPTLNNCSADVEEKIPEYTIAERLRCFRKRARLSGYELAKLAGISAYTTNAIERGRITNPSIYTISAICDALRISIVEFFSVYIYGVYDINISLMEEIKYLTPADQVQLAQKLKERRLNSD